MSKCTLAFREVNLVPSYSWGASLWLFPGLSFALFRCNYLVGCVTKKIAIRRCSFLYSFRTENAHNPTLFSCHLPCQKSSEDDRSTQRTFAFFSLYSASFDAFPNDAHQYDTTISFWVHLSHVVSHDWFFDQRIFFPRQHPTKK